MNREKIIKAILLEYSLLAPDGGASKVDADLLFKAIENLGYQDHFSFDKLEESSDIINKMVPHLPEATSSNPKYLSSSDIDDMDEILGDIPKPTDEELKSVDISNVELPDKFPIAKCPPTVSALTVGQMVEKINSASGKFKITQTGKQIKMYGDDSRLPVSGINLPQGLTIFDRQKISTNFKNVLLWLRFYQQHKNKIDIGQAVDPNEKTKISASNLKEYFDKHNPDKISFKLFFKNLGKSFNSNVKVDSAEFITGTKKADIALSDKGKETFWISFKAADYYSAEGSSELAKVGVRHYGLIATLSQQLAKDPTWRSMEDRLLAGLKKHMSGVLIDEKTTKFDEQGNLVVLNNQPINRLFNEGQLTIIKNSAAAISKLFENKTSKKYLYVPDPSNPFFGYLQMLESTSSKQAKEIAGKSIYGLDFKIDGAPFGRENCSVVMFSKTPLLMDKHVTDTPEPALLIKTDALGNVYPNPFLPLPESEGDPIFRYLPTFEVKTKSISDKHDFYVGNEHYLFLTTRIAITPRSKIKDGSIDLSK
jgi:hypothetical protein